MFSISLVLSAATSMFLYNAVGVITLFLHKTLYASYTAQKRSAHQVYRTKESKTFNIIYIYYDLHHVYFRFFRYHK